MVPLACIDRIQRGAHSKRFSLARHEALSSDENDILLLLEERDQPACLTIVYRPNDSSTTTAGPLTSSLNRLHPNGGTVTSNYSTGLETLDLIIPKAADYEILLTALEDLTVIDRENRQRFTLNLQMLHNAWTELGKEWEAPIGHTDWLALCDKLQVPLKRSTVSALFKDETRDKEERLSFAEVATLLETVKYHAVPQDKNILERIWTDMVATDPVPSVDLTEGESNLELNLQKRQESVSVVAFLSFLRSQQKEYLTSLEDATTLVQVLNQQVSLDDLVMKKPVTTDRLTKSRFYSFLTSDSNDLMNPDRGRLGADDMTRPLSHYWINTSHDTYLASLPPSFHGKSAYSRFARSGGHQQVDEQGYAAALWRGVRCIEVDLYDGLETVGSGPQPVVARYQPTPDHNNPANRTSLQLVCGEIYSFLEQHPYSFPILLKLENHCSPRVQVEVTKILQDTLGDLLVQAEDYLSSSNLDDPMTLPSPEAMRGKVVIIGKRPKKMQLGRRLTSAGDKPE